MELHDVRIDLARQVEAAGLFLARNCEALIADIEDNYLEMGGLSITVDIERPGSLRFGAVSI